MKTEITELATDLSKFKPGLIFDADGVSLFGKFHDEMSAWRAKKRWTEVLHDYFLLEVERDYEIQVLSDLNTLTFCVSCSFASACGRYAFWRLINHQAPEAEKKLGGTINQAQPSQVLGSGVRGKENDTWIVAPLGEASEKNKEAAQIIRKLLNIFK